MSIFRKSVVNKYLKNLDTDKVNKAYNNFQKFYGDKERLHNIMQLKEENYQEGFLREIFVQTLGYTINPDKNYDLTTEFKNQKDSRKANGAILKDGNAIGVIELKSIKTKDIESIKEQAFGYKNNQPNCKYVVTSNFQSIRFYIDNATEYEEFNLFELSEERFKIFYLLLSKESIINHLPEKLKQETKFHDEQITQKLYKDYKTFKDRIFDFLCSGNTQYDRLTLFKKSQKLLDRFLFILFAEDSGLIPPNAIRKIIEQWRQLKELEKDDTLYSRFQLFFTHLDKGHTYKNWGEILAYNGGLFRFDEILDNPELKLPDGLLQNNLPVLSAYDFSSEVDVNILGHIFEHSLSEIEELTAELQGEIIDRTKSKRKKDGIFYTPKYITKYIVENTVGTLCNEKKTEFQIKGLLIDDTYYQKNGKLNQKGKDLFETLQTYKNWLLTLKILDPACGSGAFLNQTLDYLIAQHKEIDNIISELTGDKIRMFDTDKQILENNIFGVDINDESIEIAKLSLWLRTAQRGRTLSDLSGNIKCGNSLIDDPEVAGEKAFDWNTEFKEIMDNGGFDVVLGNPPYVRRRTFDDKTRNYFKKFKTGSQDTAILFIKKAKKLINKQGLIGYIVPKSLLFASNWDTIRRYITPFLRTVIDCGKVWEEVLLEQVIFVANSNKLDTYKTGATTNETIVDNKTINKNYITFFDFLPANMPQQIIDIGHKVKKKSISLNDIADNIAGVPYQKFIKNEGKFSMIGGAEFNRIGIKRIKGKIDEKWAKTQNAFIQPNSVLVQNIIAHITRPVNHIKITACIPKGDIENIVLANTVNQLIIKKEQEANYSNKYLWCILNSKITNWYAYLFVFGSAIRTMHFYNPISQKIPVPVISKEQLNKFEKYTDKVIELYNEFQTEKQNFINTLKEEKHLQKNTKALENFNELDFEGLKKEISKQKARFVLGQETNEWREYFNTTKQKVNELQNQINQTDKEIDRMVYELYELTPEEIEIVEKSVK